MTNELGEFNGAGLSNLSLDGQSRLPSDDFIFHPTGSRPIVGYIAISHNDDCKTANSRLSATVFGIFALSVLLFAASLTQDCVYVSKFDNTNGVSCLLLLLFGWLAVSWGVFAWLANPALILTWLLMCFRSLRIPAVCCAVLSLVLALSFLLHQDIFAPLPLNSGPAKIISYGIGYWLWIGSVVTSLIGCVVAVIISRKT